MTTNHKLAARAQHQMTDLGNAERLVQRHGTDIRYCHPWRKWVVWDGRCWRDDTTGEVERRARSTVRCIYGEAELAEDLQARQNLAKHATKSEAKERIAAMIALAQSKKGIPLLPNELDADPWLLNCLNGTVDLRTGELREHRRADLISKLVPVEYFPSAACPVFETLLNQITNGIQEMARFIQRAFGYSLTGDNREQVLFILHGRGANGKSHFSHDVLGDYAMRTQRQRIPKDVSRLKAARFVHNSESEEGKHLAESRIKDLTGE